MNKELQPIGLDGQAIEKPTLEEFHNFNKAQERHNQAGDILAALINIEAYRLDALARYKKALPESEEQEAAASALVVLNAKRKEAQRNYAAYFNQVLSLIK